MALLGFSFFLSASSPSSSQGHRRRRYQVSKWPCVVEHGWKLKESARRLIPSRLIIRDYVQRHRWASTKASTHPSKSGRPPAHPSRRHVPRPADQAPGLRTLLLVDGRSSSNATSHQPGVQPPVFTDPQSRFPCRRVIRRWPRRGPL